MKAKTGFGNMAGKGSAKRPYNVKKFDANYLKRSGQVKTCNTCRYRAIPMYGPIPSTKAKCVKVKGLVIPNIDTFLCTRWEAK